MIVQSEVGKSITLICPAIGTPDPTITWFKNGSPLETFDINDQYRLSNIQLTDQGMYQCTATNIAGTTHKLFNVSVHSKLFV